MFEQFIKERQYITNVSPRTIEWYKESFQWLRIEQPTKDDLTDFVMRMRNAGLKATSCNNRIRAVNGYLHWLTFGTEKKCGPGCDHLKVPKLKEPELILPTFTVDQIRLIKQYHPRTDFERRLQLLILLLADTLCRITEALSLEWPDVDLNSLLVKIRGKGNKERLIPFSLELRKYLIRYQKRVKHSLVFATRDGLPLDRHVSLRDVKRLCRKLGFEPPRRTQHSLRHTGAIHYLRKGGSVFHLQKQLGHSDLAMTRKYANLLTEDLQQVHPQVSLLAS
jgi:integrase/recombinase XerD